MQIPYNDLPAQHAKIRQEIDQAIADVIRTGSFIGKNGNPFVEEFEKSFASYTSSDFCIGCANGTDAIEIALRALEIGKGDEVIVPAQTWISTAEAVTFAGATPVFADIDPHTYTLSPESVLDHITPRTKALIPVHLYGLPANMNDLLEISRENGLKVIEDCAQAHGAKIDGIHVGNFGNCGTFSFFPGKNLGAMGDAGGIVTNDPKLAVRLCQLRDHGRDNRLGHAVEGRNSRLDGLQAAILSVKLPHLDSWIIERGEAARLYLSGLEQLNIRTQEIREGYQHAYHIFGVEVQKRDWIRNELQKNGISTGLHYPIALPNLEAYATNNTPGPWNIAQHHSLHTLSLPLYPGITEEQIHYILKKISVLTNP